MTADARPLAEIEGLRNEAFMARTTGGPSWRRASS
jgi:hypothetical protein